MKKVLTGNQVVAWGVMLSRAQVVSAYPITPQTTIIEEIADLINKGMFQARFIKVESEHSAMAGCIGAQSTGARSFTATSAQGLALMHELLHWAGLGRLPIVLANVNRAMAPGWTIWTDQNDSLSQRDTGWIQYYCETVQEVLDTVIQAYRVAEQVDLPAMLVLDAFFLSHTAEAVEIPEQKITDDYLPPFEAEWKLDVDNPRAFSGMTGVDIYQEFRYKQQIAFDEALKVAEEADREYGEKFGRSYGIVENYRCDDAELIIVASGTVSSTAREAIDYYRAKGEKAGMLKIRLFRPFPLEAVRASLAHCRKIAVIDRNISPGHGGIFAQEIKSALYNQPVSKRPMLFPFIAGLGGRDIRPETVNQIIEIAKSEDYPRKDIYWIDLKE
ncbi:MAG: pyruvate ferredoxin oxidoreductase [candidate division Zixibacteria bacterium]|nr:pyruvate ferredoxin oxidoreductase [Candidatus Tariuqbacter arcticus]